MAKDISNQTVFVLAILAILVSVLSMATIFFETSDVRIGGAETDTSTAQIKLLIADEPVVSTSDASITLAINDAS